MSFDGGLTPTPSTSTGMDAVRDASLKSRLAFHSDHAFKLGLFAANCSSGGFMTTVPQRWSASWTDNLRAGAMADDAGFDFLLPLARWKGYGGETDFEGTTLETLTWATALLAQTKRISVFATIHVPLFHPIVAAKQMVVADHVSEGRFGLNIVCGWNEDEFDMFGVELRDHELRYEYAQEWLDIVLKLWREEDDFDFNGAFFKLKKARAKPKPYGGARPIFMNAGNSPTGQDFAGRNCDAYFGRVRPECIAEDAAKMSRIKTVAAQSGREVEMFSAGKIVCRPTRKEAEEYYRYCAVDNVDWGAVDNMLRLRRVDLAAMSAEAREKARREAALGGGGLPILGSPDDIAAQFAAMHHVGLRGYGAVLVNYVEELPYLCAELLPRLERLGLRTKPVAARRAAS